MGYTHYWGFVKPPKGQAQQTEADYQRALTQCRKVVNFYQKRAYTDDRLSGYTAHTLKFVYGGLKINGKGPLMHEDFVMREHFNQNKRDTSCYAHQFGWDFCKTARKPYDEVVVACLIILTKYLGASIEPMSDGDREDWKAGLKLARRATRLTGLRIPKDIVKAA